VCMYVAEWMNDVRLSLVMSSTLNNERHVTLRTKVILDSLLSSYFRFPDDAQSPQTN
jgi:hypothetical protein